MPTPEGPADSACLHPARPLAPQQRPRRATLRLPDGYCTSVYVHAAPSAPHKLPVLYVHGIQSHPGWFVGSAAAMADRGHEVFQVTRRGSGDNREARGHARSAAQLLDDLDLACRWALRQTHAQRLHLLGVSWGGKLAAAYAADAGRAAKLASLALVAPGIAPLVDVPRGVKLAVALSVVLAPRRRFDIPLNEPELFTENEPMLHYLRDDPLALHQATARFLYASRCLDGQLRRARSGALAVPTTLILARRDRIIDNTRTRQAVERLTGGAVTVLEMPSAHVLEFEPDPQPYHAALCAALED